MRRTFSNVVRFAVLFLCTSVLAQVANKQDRVRISVPWPVARLSFQSDLPIDPMVSSYPQVCMALHQDGRYSVLRRSSKGYFEGLQGSLTVEQQKVLSDLLSRAREEKSTGGVLLRRGAEFLRMELPREKKAAPSSTIQREAIPLDTPEDKVRWYWVSEPDGGTVFPVPVRNIVDWLQQFEPAKAKHVDISAQDVCPGGEVKPLQPIAAN